MRLNFPERRNWMRYNKKRYNRFLIYTKRVENILFCFPVSIFFCSFQNISRLNILPASVLFVRKCCDIEIVNNFIKKKHFDG